MGTIASPISSLTNAVGDLATQLLTSQADRVQTFTAYVQAPAQQTIANAQYIEDLRPNQDRLDVFSSMSAADTQEYYKFNLNSSSNVHFSMLADLIDENGNVLAKSVAKGLNVQVMQMHGNTPQVVADSDPSSGDNYKNFQQLQQGLLNMQAGEYVVMVNRDPTASAEDDYKFSLKSSGFQTIGSLAPLAGDDGNVLSRSIAQGLSVQVMQMQGGLPVVVADSNPSAGANYDNFQDLQTFGLNMSVGDYTIKVNGNPLATPDANYFYSFQLVGDRSYQDFDTVQSPAPQTHGESVLSFLKPDAVSGLLAASTDVTSALAGQASMPVNGASLTAGMDPTTDPAVRLLSMFA